MNRYDTILLGASYAALGYAAVHPDVLILEAGEFLGSDYHACLRPCQSPALPHSPQALALHSFFKEKQILTDDRLDVLREAAAVCRYAQEQPWFGRVRLEARVISVERKNGLFEVEYYTNTGIHRAAAKHVLDTTACRVSLPGAAVKEKQLHVVCSDVPADFETALTKENDTLRFTPGYCTGEWTVTFPFAPEATLSQARETVENTWRAVFPGGEALIDVVGFEFDPVVQPTAGDVPWLCPHTFGDPLTAFDAGAQFDFAEEADA